MQLTGPVLRDQLATLLANELGTYTLLNGAETPAISLRPIGQTIPAGTTVTGLEVVVIAEPQLTPVNAYLAQFALREFFVYFVGWDATADSTTAAEKVIATFPGTTQQLIPLNKKDGPANQFRLIITAPATVNLPQNVGTADGNAFNSVAALSFTP